MVIFSFANEKSCKGFFLYLVVLVLAYSDVFWRLHMYMLCFMFIAANIVGCRLRHQDARCTHRSSNKIVAATKLQSIAFFFCKFLCAGRGGAPTVRFAPVVPSAKTGPACPTIVSCSVLVT
jgi:hypothetical protein